MMSTKEPPIEKSLEADMELARDFRDMFIRYPKAERPPCFDCPDSKLSYCIKTEFQCMPYKIYVSTGNIS
jgi:hypothetical protein